MVSGASALSWGWSEYDTPWDSSINTTLWDYNGTAVITETGGLPINCVNPIAENTTSETNSYIQNYVNTRVYAQEAYGGYVTCEAIATQNLYQITDDILGRDVILEGNFYTYVRYLRFASGVNLGQHAQIRLRVYWNNTPSYSSLFDQLTSHVVSADNIITNSSARSINLYWNNTAFGWDAYANATYLGFINATGQTSAKIYSYNYAHSKVGGNFERSRGWATSYIQIYNYSIGPAAYIVYPTNNTNYNAINETIFYPVYPVNDTDIDACVFYANNTIVGTNNTAVTKFNNNTMPIVVGEGVYEAYISCNLTTGEFYNSSVMWFGVDATNPSVTINNPPNLPYDFAGQPVNINITMQDNIELNNCTYVVYDHAGAVFTTNTTACSGTNFEMTGSFTPNLPGVWNITATAEDLAGNTATSSTEFIINGISISVYDEKTLADIPAWNITIANSTSSETYTGLTNPFLWDNFTGIPTGPITISITASGYANRIYHRTYAPNSYVRLNAYLLGSADGLYSYFVVRDNAGNNLADALLIFSFISGSTTITAGETITDSTGSATMWLDWTKTYTVTTTKDGYTPVVKSITPQPTTYVIVMGSGSIFEFSNVNDSFWVFLNPTNPEVNTTTDSLTAGVYDPASTISICGLNLTYINGTVFHSVNTTTEQRYCVNTVPLLGTGADALDSFYGVVWWELNTTETGHGARLYRPLRIDYLMYNVQSDLFAYMGTEARLMLAVFITLLAGAGASFYLGSGAVLIMMATSGMLFYWGWFAGYEGLWIIAVMAGLALLWLERGGGGA